MNRFILLLSLVASHSVIAETSTYTADVYVGVQPVKGEPDYVQAYYSPYQSIVVKKRRFGRDGTLLYDSDAQLRQKLSKVFDKANQTIADKGAHFKMRNVYLIRMDQKAFAPFANEESGQLSIGMEGGESGLLAAFEEVTEDNHDAFRVLLADLVHEQGKQSAAAHPGLVSVMPLVETLKARNQGKLLSQQLGHNLGFSRPAYEPQMASTAPSYTPPAWISEEKKPEPTNKVTTRVVKEPVRQRVADGNSPSYTPPAWIDEQKPSNKVTTRVVKEPVRQQVVNGNSPSYTPPSWISGDKEAEVSTRVRKETFKAPTQTNKSQVTNKSSGSYRWGDTQNYTPPAWIVGEEEKKPAPKRRTPPVQQTGTGPSYTPPVWITNEDGSDSEDPERRMSVSIGPELGGMWRDETLLPFRYQSGMSLDQTFTESRDCEFAYGFGAMFTKSMGPMDFVTRLEYLASCSDASYDSIDSNGFDLGILKPDGGLDVIPGGSSDLTDVHYDDEYCEWKLFVGVNGAPHTRGRGSVRCRFGGMYGYNDECNMLRAVTGGGSYDIVYDSEVCTHRVGLYLGGRAAFAQSERRDLFIDGELRGIFNTADGDSRYKRLSGGSVIESGSKNLSADRWDLGIQVSTGATQRFGDHFVLEGVVVAETWQIPKISFESTNPSGMTPPADIEWEQRYSVTARLDARYEF